MYGYIFAFLLVCLCGTTYVSLEGDGIYSAVEGQNKFRIKYLSVYLLAMFADWLQGPYVYVLYESYGFSISDIALLFIAGFGSSMVFGAVVGSMSDL
jgi:MFS transporter, MFS domain-containing protein family, molybdate-anion transporter